MLVRPPSEHDCLRVLPSLSAHLCREQSNDNNSSKTGTNDHDGSGGPHALFLSSSINGRTEFALAAWRSFVPPTTAEDREQYFGPKAVVDVRLEWDASDDLEMERRAIRRACECVPLEKLRSLSVRTEAAVWGAQDWCDTFLGSVEITHVAALEKSGESVLDALNLPRRTRTITTSTNSSSGTSDRGVNEGNREGSKDDQGDKGGGSGPLPPSPPLFP